MYGLTQNPQPGTHIMKYRGDTLTINFEVPLQLKNPKAYFHTNIGFASLRREEIIENVEDNTPISSEDWHDMPMQVDSSTPGKFILRLALNEVGHFEGKACVIEEGSSMPIWVEGEHIHVNVESAMYCCANSIYCAFIRQYGHNKNRQNSQISKTEEFTVRNLDDSGYTVIPPSGTFRDFIKELDFVTDKLKCRIIHLLPINPVPTTYARMGRYGSPYAALDFTAIDPAYAEFDRYATPLDQFLELVDAVHYRGAKLIIDLAINHTGWAAKLHETHPDWLVRDPDGAIHSPGAWGVVWGDLTELNHNCLDLWEYLADVFLTWCSRGVDGFRCDAGYMIPFPAWQYIIARVRKSYPDAIFLLEGLGGDPAVTRKLLNEANMNWAYSELFQNYSREAIEGYLNYSDMVSGADGLLVHYAETHDNLRLAATSPAWARMRTALCALTSTNGAFGFTNGVEWLAKEKIDVHSASALNWGASDNMVDYIGRLNLILMRHPAFHPDANIRFIDSYSQDAILVFRSDKNNQNHLLICININCQQPVIVKWRPSNVLFHNPEPFDLITGRNISPLSIGGGELCTTLQPGEVLCLSDSDSFIQNTENIWSISNTTPEEDRLKHQTLRAQILDLMCWKNQSCELPPKLDIMALAHELYQNPDLFLTHFLGDSEYRKVVTWHWPEDHKRQVMIPPEHVLMVKSDVPFRAHIVEKDGRIHRLRDSILSADGTWFVMFAPQLTPRIHTPVSLRIYTTDKGRSARCDAPLLILGSHVESVPLAFDNVQMRKSTHTALLTNGRGAMIRPALEWGELHDRYCTMLAVNFSENFPEDRHIMFRRLRIKVQHEARIEYLRLDLTKEFILNKMGEPIWTFKVPIGKGLHILLQVRILAVPNENAVKVVVRRLEAEDHSEASDIRQIRVMLCPDLEDRSFHNETKAFMGPEHDWPQKITPSFDGSYITFAPSEDRILSIGVSKGNFISHNKWFYNQYQKREAARGLEANTDVWHPGDFQLTLDIGESVVLHAHVKRSLNDAKNSKFDFSFDNANDLWVYDSTFAQFNQALPHAMKQFVVKRDAWQTVIAGYPWFLDWGRDTLICVRGLLAGGFTQTVRDILCVFARFAEQGTLPNIIHGNDVGNRDTSDATLWLFTALNDYLEETGDQTLLTETFESGKNMIETLVDIYDWMLKGPPNGIKVDAESNLVYSPPHFTWMDTNYPAGTPREGYPIEIQALWFAAQNVLFKITKDAKYSTAAQKTKASVLQYFVLPSGALSDCLNAQAHQTASQAVQTDHLRPNQLFAITLGMIDDPKISAAILAECAKLLIPGAIRSLADQAVQVPIPVDKDGQLLNDPTHPYWGNYEGDEDTRRKPAYHNGTAWTWPFPSFPEALVQVYGESSLSTAKAYLSSIDVLLNQGCVGQLPEVLDGDFPHTFRGCDAQAWGATEAYRVWHKLQQYASEQK